MTEPFRIVFVCTGNVCRSPMAETFLKNALDERGLASPVEVLSAGTAAVLGQTASSSSVSACRPYGVSLGTFRSTPLTLELCEAAHLLLVMDYPHREYVEEHFPDCADKIRLLGSFLFDEPGRMGIPDPIGGTPDLYQRVAEVIHHAVSEVVQVWDHVRMRFYENPRLVIAIGADHRGYEDKEKLKALLEQLDFPVIDCGTDSYESCDHPDFAFRVAELVSRGVADRGILTCSSGHGMVISANKVPSVRAVLPFNSEHARLARTHNNANVLVLGADYIPWETIRAIVGQWLQEDFLGGKYQRRINKISHYEQFLRC